MRFQVDCPVSSSNFSSYHHSFVSPAFRELSISYHPRDDAISCSDPRSKMKQLKKPTKHLLVEDSSLIFLLLIHNTEINEIYLSSSLKTIYLRKTFFSPGQASKSSICGAHLPRPTTHTNIIRPRPNQCSFPYARHHLYSLCILQHVSSRKVAFCSRPSILFVLICPLAPPLSFRTPLDMDASAKWLHHNIIVPTRSLLRLAYADLMSLSITWVMKEIP